MLLNLRLIKKSINEYHYKLISNTYLLQQLLYNIIKTKRLIPQKGDITLKVPKIFADIWVNKCPGYPKTVNFLINKKGQSGEKYTK
jgi:hypothetical protein